MSDGKLFLLSDIFNIIPYIHPSLFPDHLVCRITTFIHARSFPTSCQVSISRIATITSSNICNMSMNEPRKPHKYSHFKHCELKTESNIANCFIAQTYYFDTQTIQISACEAMGKSAKLKHMATLHVLPRIT